MFFSRILFSSIIIQSMVPESVLTRSSLHSCFPGHHLEWQLVHGRYVNSAVSKQSLALKANLFMYSMWHVFSLDQQQQKTFRNLSPWWLMFENKIHGEVSKWFPWGCECIWGWACLKGRGKFYTKTGRLKTRHLQSRILLHMNTPIIILLE